MTAFLNPNPASFATPPRLDPVYAAWNTVASYDDYALAQRAVDTLSDRGFPVQEIDIVGSDVRLVERVTGRLTKGRATAAGAASGAWFGLFLGLLVGLFGTGPWFGWLIAGGLLGAAWGALFAFMGQASTRGARDFASARTLMALRYDLVARNGQADAARRMLADLDGPTSV